jgi:hypothetical protein
MAKTKAYSVRRAFAARHKETNEEVWVTRENEHLIPDMLSTTRIKDYVDSGALEEYETDSTAAGALNEPAKPPATGARKH